MIMLVIGGSLGGGLGCGGWLFGGALGGALEGPWPVFCGVLWRAPRGRPLGDALEGFRGCIGRCLWEVPWEVLWGCFGHVLGGALMGVRGGVEVLRKSVGSKLPCTDSVLDFWTESVQ